MKVEIEYTSVSVQNTSRAKILGILALAVIGTLVASYTAFSTIPAKTQLRISNNNVDSEAVNHFIEWKKIHNITFDRQEEAKRYNIFAQTHEQIKQHNAGNETYSLGHNKFSHLTTEEFLALYEGNSKLFDPKDIVNATNDGSVGRILGNDQKKKEKIPDSLNWVTQGAVTPVGDQGECRGCYSFAAAGALESYYYIRVQKKKKVLVEFSKQQLLECTRSGQYNGFRPNNGCDGGNAKTCFDFVKANKGIAEEKDYPYRKETFDNANLKACDRGVKSLDIEYHGYFTLIGRMDGDFTKGGASSQFIDSIYIGPTATMIRGDGLKQYKGGIMTAAKFCPTPKEPTHGVLAVGYNIENKNQRYFLVKNSWGAGWGEQGYFRVEMTDDNGPGVCGFQHAGITPM